MTQPRRKSTFTVRAGAPALPRFGPLTGIPFRPRRSRRFPQCLHDTCLSPDGDRVLVVAEGDAWIYDIASGRESRVTTDGQTGNYAGWTPSGDRVTYTSGRDATGGTANVWIQPADGSGVPEQLTALDGSIHFDSWAPDGRTFAAHQHAGGTTNQLMIAVDEAAGEPGRNTRSDARCVPARRASSHDHPGAPRAGGDRSSVNSRRTRPDSTVARTGHGQATKHTCAYGGAVGPRSCTPTWGPSVEKSPADPPPPPPGGGGGAGQRRNLTWRIRGVRGSLTRLRARRAARRSRKNLTAYIGSV